MMRTPSSAPVMNDKTLTAPPSRIAAWLLALPTMFLIVKFGLVGALLAGLLVYQLIDVLAPLVERMVRGARARVIAVVVLAIFVVGLLTLAIVGVVTFINTDAGGQQALLARLMDIIDASRGQLPQWALPYLPEDMSELRQALKAWIDEHRAELSIAGAEAVQTAARLLIGMVLGAMIALYDEFTAPHLGPFGRELVGRVGRFSDSFRRVVFAQIKISLLNTTFTAIFLLVVLPLFGVHLPLAKTLVLITFVAGLLPVIGNLISNTVITIVALSVSLYVAVAALAYLIVIHKLEYFLNARIVGGEIRARAWELLLAMLTMEALFGMPGLIVAPIYYAYIKRELVDQGWV